MDVDGRWGKQKEEKITKTHIPKKIGMPKTADGHTIGIVKETPAGFYRDLTIHQCRDSPRFCRRYRRQYPKQWHEMFGSARVADVRRLPRPPSISVFSLATTREKGGSHLRQTDPHRMVAIRRSDGSIRLAQMLPPDLRYLSRTQRKGGYILVRSESDRVSRVSLHRGVWMVDEPKLVSCFQKTGLTAAHARSWWRLGGWVAASKAEVDSLPWLTKAAVPRGVVRRAGALFSDERDDGSAWRAASDARLQARIQARRARAVSTRYNQESCVDKDPLDPCVHATGARGTCRIDSANDLVCRH